MSTTNQEQVTIKIKIGELEVDYTGSQSFVENGLLEIVQNLTDAAPTPSNIGGNSGIVSAGETTQNSTMNYVSTNTIASHLSAQSGPDLIIAAVAHLLLVKGQNEAARSEISKEMKGATTYYKTTFGSNMSAYLNNLVKAKRLNQVAKQTYALSSTERHAMEALIAAT